MLLPASLGLKKNTGTTKVPDLPASVAPVSLGLDGATLLYRDGHYRTAMCGIISLLNGEGERLHTTYCAAAPEYGKQIFMRRLTGEIEKIKEKFPDVTYVEVAGGAPDNWTFLKPFVSYQVLDFCHVSEYVADAAEVFFPGTKNEKTR